MLEAWEWSSNTAISSSLTGSLIYEKLGEKAFGWPGKIGAFVSITMQNLGGKWEAYNGPLELSVGSAIKMNDYSTSGSEQTTTF